MDDQYLKGEIQERLISSRLGSLGNLIRKVGELDHDDVREIDKILKTLQESQPTHVKRLRKIIEDVER